VYINRGSWVQNGNSARQKLNNNPPNSLATRLATRITSSSRRRLYGLSFSTPIYPIQNRGSMNDIQPDPYLISQGYTHFPPGNASFTLRANCSMINCASGYYIRVNESDTTDVSPIPQFMIVYLPFFPLKIRELLNPILKFAMEIQTVLKIHSHYHGQFN